MRLSIASVPNSEFAYTAAPSERTPNSKGHEQLMIKVWSGSEVLWKKVRRGCRELLNSLTGPYGISFAVVERPVRLILHSFALAIAGAALLMNQAAAAPVTAGTTPIKMVVLGDSLSAGYQLPSAAAFPARLEKALKAKGINVDIINAGVSGDTTSGGRDRLDWSVPAGTQAVILELGANDALRGTDPKVTRAALTDILTQLRARNIAVLLCGMYAPPNYGADYSARFNAIYPELAKTFQVSLYPFFLDGVATVAKLNQADGLHPTAEGIDLIVKNIPAYGRSIPRHAIRATQLKNGQR